MLLRMLTARQFEEWVSYYESNPFGEERADWRAGMIASVLASCHSKTRYKPADFMPTFKQKTPQTEAQMKHALRMFTAARRRNG